MRKLGGKYDFVSEQQIIFPRVLYFLSSNTKLRETPPVTTGVLQSKGITLKVKVSLAAEM